MPRATLVGRSFWCQVNARDLDNVEADEADENGPLLPTVATPRGFLERERPQTRIRYGFLGLQSRKTDALDHYDEQLRHLDDAIRLARRKVYPAADLAFVSMDSTAACQMAIQALLDPRPGVLLTKLAPSPSDVVWANTYATRTTRRLRISKCFCTMHPLTDYGNHAVLPSTDPD